MGRPKLDAFGFGLTLGAMEIVLVSDPERSDVEAVETGLIASNIDAAGRDRGYQPLVLHLVDPQTGIVVGGLSGWTLFDWLYVDLLHVPPSLQGQGHGRALLQRAEAFAQERNCVGVWLDTFSFQARPFYEKQGFSVFGTLEDHPIGGRRFFMQKRFVP